MKTGFWLSFDQKPEKESSTRQSKLGYNWFQVALQLKQKILVVLLLQNERKKFKRLEETNEEGKKGISSSFYSKDMRINILPDYHENYRK